MDALYIHSPCWVQEELHLSKPPSRTDIKNGTVHVGVPASRAKTTFKTTGQEEKPGEEEKEKKEVHLSGRTSWEESLASFVSSLKACAQQKDLDRGMVLHKDVIEMGFLEDEHLGSTLIFMYAKCGSILEAQHVFDELQCRNIISWTLLIAGYAERGQNELALACFERMKCEGVSPDRITFLSVLRACGNIGAVDKSQETHAQILKSGLFLETDVVLGTALVDVYAKCNLLTEAIEVFDALHAPDVVAWNALITGYACYGHGQDALDCFESMQLTGVSPNAITFSVVLKTCGSLAASDTGRKIHAKVLKEGLLAGYDISIANSLVDMYAKCGVLAKAEEVFDELPSRDIVTWNALIAGQIQNGKAEDALKCFDEMQLEAFSPDAFTYSCILKACGVVGVDNKGLELHAEITREGVLDNNVVVGNALIDMYSKCGLLVEAQDVFDNLSNQNVVSWSALIVGYANHGLGHQALNCFEQMLSKGFCPNAVTLLGVLKACGSIGASSKGQEIHAEIVKDELLERDVVLGTALVDMYAKCGLLTDAQDVFDESPWRDSISWNALLAGYSQYMHTEAALECFEKMQLWGFSPDLVTFVCVLKACGCIGATRKAQEIHSEFVRDGLLESDLVVGNSLIDMYASCGMLAEAQDVFDSLQVRDLVSWNTLIAGYAQLGKGEEVFDMLNKLVAEFGELDSITLTVVLNTCSHLGFMNKGELIFATMCAEYGILPTVEHYACLIDLFCRAGHIERALSTVKESPFAADVLVWNSLLGACQKQGSIKLGRWAFEHAAQLGERDSAAFVGMSNFYAADNSEGNEYNQLLHIWAVE